MDIYFYLSLPPKIIFINVPKPWVSSKSFLKYGEKFI